MGTSPGAVECLGCSAWPSASLPLVNTSLATGVPSKVSALSACAKGWRRQWEQVTPFFAFSAPIRRAIYTTNAVESLNSTVRRAVRSKGHFPHDDAARKLIYLALRGVAAKWKRPPQFWWQVKGEFAIRFEERFTMAQG